VAFEKGLMFAGLKSMRAFESRRWTGSVVSKEKNSITTRRSDSSTRMKSHVTITRHFRWFGQVSPRWLATPSEVTETDM
jgi:hypothetical protein